MFLFTFSFCLIPERVYTETAGISTEALTDCLIHTYQIDKKTIQKIINKLSPLSNDPNKSHFIQKFIDLSKNIFLNTKNPSSPLLEYDAWLKAPESHDVIFENSVLRIFYISIKAGEEVPLHTHQWENITIVIQGSLFASLDQEGNLSIQDCPILVEQCEKNLEPHSYINMGSHEFIAISFEFKD